MQFLQNSYRDRTIGHRIHILQQILRVVGLYKFLSFLFLFNYCHITAITFVKRSLYRISYVDRYNYTIYFKYCLLQGRVVSRCDIIRLVLLARYPPHNCAIGARSAGIYAALTIDTFQSLANLATSNIDSTSIHTSSISFLPTFSSLECIVMSMKHGSLTGLSLHFSSSKNETTNGSRAFPFYPSN